MYSRKFIALKEEYQSERGTEFSNDQFAALLYSFPSLLVALADGKIDLGEKNFLKHLPAILTEGYNEAKDGLEESDATLTDDYFSEAEYIRQNLVKWEKTFLDSLKEQLHNSLNERNAIFKSMWQTADSSSDISQQERSKIDEISSALEL